MNKLKSNRAISFVVVFLSYILAMFLSLITFYIFNNNYIWLRIYIADIAGTLTIYLLSIIFDNASLYDPYWSVQPLVIVWGTLSLSTINIGSLLVCLVISYWGIRLTCNWAYTFCGLNHMDWRYSMLKEKTGTFYPLVNLLGIQLFPTTIVWACILPVVYYILKAKSAINIITLLGLFISITATTLQLISDIQMHRFRKRNGDNSMIIRDGLWKYSRHPNYLGEILMWWGVYIVLVSVLPSYWYLAIGPIANTMLFLFISIPLAENRLKSYKKGFDEYIKETRMLLPVRK